MKILEAAADLGSIMVASIATMYGWISLLFIVNVTTWYVDNYRKVSICTVKVGIILYSLALHDKIIIDDSNVNMSPLLGLPWYTWKCNVLSWEWMNHNTTVPGVVYSAITWVQGKLGMSVNILWLLTVISLAYFLL